MVALEKQETKKKVIDPNSHSLHSNVHHHTSVCGICMQRVSQYNSNQQHLKIIARSIRILAKSYYSLSFKLPIKIK